MKKIKKLSLKVETIRVLTDEALSWAVGGATLFQCTVNCVTMNGEVTCPYTANLSCPFGSCTPGCTGGQVTSAC